MTFNTKLTVRFLFRQIKRYKTLLIILLASIALGSLIDIIVPYFYKIFFDVLTSQAAESSRIAATPLHTAPDIIGKLVKILLLILGINIVQWAFWRIAQSVNNYFQPRVMANIINECFEYLHQHSYDFFNNSFSGALVKRITRLAHAFEDIADKTYWDLLPLIVKTGAILVVMFSTHPFLGALLSGWLAVFIVFNYLFSLYKLKFDIARSKADTKVTARLADTITNAVTIKLFTSLNFELAKFMEITHDWFQKVRKAWDLGHFVEAIQAFLMILIEFLMMFFAIKFWQKGLLTIGDFVLIQALLFDLFMRFWDLGRIIRDFYERFADAEEMIVILNTPHEVKDRPRAKKLNVVRGKIEFRNVNFSYSGELGVIHNLNLIVKPGEKIALIGPSGGGKSTLVKLLLRFFDIQKGEILIDDQNIVNAAQQSLRSHISLVPQDPILFHRTLMENIRYGQRGARDEEVIAASKMARCREFIEAFPKKYDTLVGERGVKLSGGERQRVAVARAILKNAPILILDEATSSLDSHSEILIQEALANLMKNKTTLVIAHRLSTIMKMDRILVLQNGVIIESGAHKELLQREDGLYKKLWELQSGGYIDV